MSRNIKLSISQIGMSRFQIFDSKRIFILPPKTYSVRSLTANCPIEICDCRVPTFGPFIAREKENLISKGGGRATDGLYQHSVTSILGILYSGDFIKRPLAKIPEG